MENNVTKLMTEKEKYLAESLFLVEEFIKLVENGNVEKFIITAYDESEQTLLSIHSKPSGVSYYEYVGYMDAVRDYMLSKATR